MTNEKHNQMGQMIDVLVIEPGMEPELQKISSGLESLQSQVGGMIEAIYPFDDNVGLVINV